MITQQEFLFICREPRIAQFEHLIKSNGLTGNEVLDQNDGRTVLMLVASQFSSKIKIDMLFHQFGAKIDLQASNGYTALMYAAIHGHHGNVQQLLSCKANPHLVNAEGKTAFQLVEALMAQQTARANPACNIDYTPIHGEFTHINKTKAAAAERAAKAAAIQEKREEKLAKAIEKGNEQAAKIQARHEAKLAKAQIREGKDEQAALVLFDFNKKRASEEVPDKIEKRFKQNF